MSWERLFDADIIVFMIPIVAIIVGGMIAIVAMVANHRERMAKIDQGIDPDRKPEEPEEDDAPPGPYPQ